MAAAMWPRAWWRQAWPSALKCSSVYAIGLARPEPAILVQSFALEAGRTRISPPLVPGATSDLRPVANHREALALRTLPRRAAGRFLPRMWRPMAFRRDI